MHYAVRKRIKRLLKKFNLGITWYSRMEQLEKSARNGDDIEFLLELPEEHSARLLRLLKASKSQYRQDLFVLSQLDFKTGGYFVEFGAASGVDKSNSYLLEKQFGWNGIVAEPARQWHASVKSSRNCNIETDCVWRESNATLSFLEAAGGEYSTIESYSDADFHRSRRKGGAKYDVKTISLLDLLDKYQAPKIVDYLSIDTEGSEYEILSAFDFSKHQFRVITCEHNFTPQRDQIHALLTAQGYVRRLERFSTVDDWYVKAI